MLIATGVRSRKWPNPEEPPWRVSTPCAPAPPRRGCRPRWPPRVLIIGSGFIGSEVASVCRDLDLDVTVAEQGPAPLSGPLSGVIGRIAAEMQRKAGVDLRTGVWVLAMEGDAGGTCGAHAV